MRAFRYFLSAVAAVLLTGAIFYSNPLRSQPSQVTGTTSICTASDSIKPPLSGSCTPVSTANPLPVSASVSASISGFTAATTGTPISVTTGGVTGTLPAGAVVVATNVGTTNAAYCALGGTATTSSQYIAPAGGWFAFTVGANTQLTCITSTSTTTVNMTGGAGLPTGTGGGGGGSGGGGAVTLASGAVSSGAYSSGSIASGAFASGSVSSGAFASGSLAAGAMVDFLTVRGTKAPGTAAANSMLGGCLYTSAGVTLTDGQQAATGCTSTGAALTHPAQGLVSLSAWNSGTAGDSTQTLMATGDGAAAIVVQLNQTTTISAGAVTFEGTNDGTNWVSIPIAAILNQQTFASLSNPYTLVASTNQPFLILTNGYRSIRVRLSTAITGSGSVTPFVQLLPNNPVLATLLNAVSISQATPGTTNNVTVSALPRAARNFTGCSVGTSSGSCLSASTATQFVQLQNTDATGVIACNWGSTAILNSAAGSFMLGVGQSASWGPMTGGVPTGQLNCIADTTTTSLYIEYL